MNEQDGRPPGGRDAPTYGQPPPPPQAGYDPAMMPRQVDAPNLEGWNPGDLNARGGLAWAAIVLCACMVLVRLAEGGLVLAVAISQHGSETGLLSGGGVFSFIAAAFYGWAALGLYKQKRSAYRWVIRVNILLAVLGAIGMVQLVMGSGGLTMGLGLVLRGAGLVFHLAALVVTYLARDNVGGTSEWAG